MRILHALVGFAYLVPLRTKEEEKYVGPRCTKNGFIPSSRPVSCIYVNVIPVACERLFNCECVLRRYYVGYGVSNSCGEKEYD